MTSGRTSDPVTERDASSNHRPLVTDGLPTLPTGEPVLYRWFVLLMLALVPIGLGVSVWAYLSIPRGVLPPEERRPVGDGEVTIDRGDAVLADSEVTEPGPGCGEEITLVGDDGTRAAARRALGATCQLLATTAFPAASDGLVAWTAADGVLRFATFEYSGVESSARHEQGRTVIELNAKFVYEDATRAAPALIHQLVLLADPAWPGAPVGASAELAATEAQADACQRLTFVDAPPRGCQDVEELLATDDPRARLVAAGFPDR
jgi:hypothetical protein